MHGGCGRARRRHRWVSIIRGAALDAHGRRRQRVWVRQILKSLCVAAALALSVPSPAPAAVVVSSKLSSESAMLGEMIRLLLNAHGVPTVDRMTLGATPVVRKALLAGEVDVYVEYTGNAGLFFNDPGNPAWKDL